MMEVSLITLTLEISILNRAIKQPINATLVSDWWEEVKGPARVMEHGLWLLPTLGYI